LPSLRESGGNNGSLTGCVTQIPIVELDDDGEHVAAYVPPSIIQ
jgi:hypothetical protein